MGTQSLARDVVDRIQRCLDSLSISASELARRMGVRQQYLSRRLTREVDLSVSDIESIAQALGTAPHRLLAPEPMAKRSADPGP